MPLRSTDFATMYEVSLTGIGPYRLFAYLSIPEGEPPFPTIFYFPNYGSVVNPIPQGATHELRRRYATFSLATRGQRNADRPFAATFPGLLTVGIASPDTYVFRGIIADCCRGIEYLLGRPEIDPTRVVAVGNNLTLIAAGLTESLSHIVCATSLLYRTIKEDEIKDYLRLNPEKEKETRRTLSYFDVRWFKKPEHATTLIVGDRDGAGMDPDDLQSLLDALGGGAEFYQTQQSAYKDGVFKENWIARQLGYDEAILPKTWQ